MRNSAEPASPEPEERGPTEAANDRTEGANKQYRQVTAGRVEFAAKDCRDNHECQRGGDDSCPTHGLAEKCTAHLLVSSTNYYIDHSRSSTPIDSPNILHSKGHLGGCRGRGESEMNADDWARGIVGLLTCVLVGGALSRWTNLQPLADLALAAVAGTLAMTLDLFWIAARVGLRPCGKRER